MVTCPRCGSHAQSATCEQCGLRVDEHYRHRARWALVSAAVANAAAVMVAWGQFGQLQEHPTWVPQVIADLRTALMLATAVAVVPVVAAVLAGQRPRLAWAAVAAIVLGAMLAIAIAPYWLWYGFLWAAPLGWTAALVGACLAGVWAGRWATLHAGLVDDLDPLG